jgi:uncharacterized delta-60 repeat protein
MHCWYRLTESLSSVTSSTQISGVARSKIARLNAADGALDTNFHPNVNFGVFALIQQPQDGKIVLGGNFTTIDNLSAQHIGRLRPDGTVVENFVATINDNFVREFALQPNGQILVVGAFISVIGQTRNRIVRLTHGGGVDQSFNPNANGLVHEVAVQADGRILLAGDFTTIGGQARTLLARLNPDGRLEAGFTPNVNAQVLSLAVQPDGKFVVSGQFTTRKWVQSALPHLLWLGRCPTGCPTTAVAATGCSNTGSRAIRQSRRMGWSKAAAHQTSSAKPTLSGGVSDSDPPPDY